MPGYWNGIGNEAGTGMGQFLQNFTQQQQLKRQEEERQRQAALQEEQFRIQNQRAQEQLELQRQEAARVAQGQQFNQDRTTRLDAAQERNTEVQQALAPQMNAFMQGVEADLVRYAPTLKDGRPNPQYNPALYDLAQRQKKQAQTLWGKVGLSIGSGEGWDDNRTAFLAFVAGDDAPTGQPAPAQPAPVQTPMAAPVQPAAPVTAAPTPAPVVPVTSPEQIPALPPGAPGQVAPQATPPVSGSETPAAPAAPKPALPPRVQDVPPSQLMNVSDDDLLAAYGQTGVEYAIAARTEYAAQVQAAQQAAIKIRVDGWSDQRKELAKRTDLDGTQRAAMLTIDTLLAKPELTADEQGRLAAAFQVLTPKMYDSTSWQKVLDTKDPGTILAMLPVYQKFNPAIVAGFDPTPLQQQYDANLNKLAADAAQSNAAAQNSAASANRTETLLPGEVQQQGATLAGTQATTANTVADTGLKVAQGDAAKVKAGLEGIELLASLPRELSYYQMAQGNPALVARIKANLGLNDQGMLNLWRQAQYSYGLGLKGEELKNTLTASQIQTEGARRGQIVADTTMTLEQIETEIATRDGKIAKLDAEIASLDANTDDARSRIAERDRLVNEREALYAAQAAQAGSSATLNLARAAEIPEQLKMDRERLAQSAAKIKSDINVDNAQIASLGATTALNRARNPNDPLYSPELARSDKDGSDPFKDAKTKAQAYYDQATRARNLATTYNTQMNAIAAKYKTVTGTINTEKLNADPEYQALKTKRDQQLQVVLNRTASGDKIIEQALSGAAPTSTTGGNTGGQGAKVNIPATSSVDVTRFTPALATGINSMFAAVPRAPNGLVPVITQGGRTPEQQAELYAQGRTKPGKIVTWTLNSNHITGNAVDISWKDPKTGKIVDPNSPAARAAYQYFGALAPKYGLTWGGTFKNAQGQPLGDLMHFEAAGSGTAQPAAPGAKPPVKTATTPPKPAATPPKPAASTGPRLPAPKNGNTQAANTFQDKLIDAIKKNDGAAVDYFGNQLVKLGYSQEQVIAWIQKVRG